MLTTASVRTPKILQKAPQDPPVYALFEKCAAVFRLAEWDRYGTNSENAGQCDSRAIGYSVLILSYSLFSRVHFRIERRYPRSAMPSSTVHAFTDPDECLAGIRNLQIGKLQIEGVVLERREFHPESAHSTRTGCLLPLRRGPASDHEGNVQRDAGGDCFRDRPRPARDADQPYRNSVRSNFQKRAGMGMVPSNLRPFGWGSMVLGAGGSGCRGRDDYLARIAAGDFRPRP